MRRCRSGCIFEYAKNGDKKKQGRSIWRKTGEKLGENRIVEDESSGVCVMLQDGGKLRFFHWEV